MGAVQKMQMATGEAVWEREIPEEIMIGVGGDFENISIYYEKQLSLVP